MGKFIGTWSVTKSCFFFDMDSGPVCEAPETPDEQSYDHYSTFCQ